MPAKPSCPRPSRPTGVLTPNLLLEVNDDAPAASKATLLVAHCPGDTAAQAACGAAKARRSIASPTPSPP